MTDELKSKINTKLRISIAQDLASIVAMYAELESELEHRSNAREIPGGEAMNQIGPAANLEAWENRFETAEREGLDTSYANDQVAERHVLLVLGDWSEQIRIERDQPTDLRVTVNRAADYIGKSLDWILEHFDGTEHMARELSQVRSALESVLAEGVRPDTSAAACFRNAITDEDGNTTVCGGELKRRILDRRDCKHAKAAIKSAKGLVDPVDVLRRLLKEFPELALEHKQCDQGGRDDVYQCSKCRSYYDTASYWQAVREHHERHG